MVIRKNRGSSKGNPAFPLFVGIDIIIQNPLSGSVLLLAVSIHMFVSILSAAETVEITQYD